MLFEKILTLLLSIPEVDYGKNIADLMARFPEPQLQALGNERTKWKVGPGAKGTGQVTFSIFQFEKATGESLVFGATDRDVAPEHGHFGGERILTLAGVGQDVEDDGSRVQLCRGSVMCHGTNTIHKPGSVGLWVFLYHQPAGMWLVE